MAARTNRSSDETDVGTSPSLWQRLLGRPASESGTLRHGDGTHGRSDRCRRSFVLPILCGSGFWGALGLIFMPIKPSIPTSR
jgi:hypothetical protein